MNAKKWSIAFLAVILLSLAFIMGANYLIDPYGYFRFRDGDYYELDDVYYTRYLKAKHLLTFADEYDAVLVGGSKSGALRVEKLSELDGYRYYNCWIKSGNFEEYEKYVQFIVKNAKVKKILLHLSSIEIKDFSRQDWDDSYATPAVVEAKSPLAETFKFLFKNLSVSQEEWKKVRNAKAAGTPLVPYPELPTGERNLGKYYAAMDEDPQTFLQTYVLTDYDKYLKSLFRKEVKKEKHIALCLEAVRNIKKTCADNGVELMLVVGPNFLTEMSVFEGTNFYAYFNDIVNIVGEVWDFSNYHELILNPGNFYNYGHYFYEMGDLMVDTITGKDAYEGFGQLVTKDNVYAYLKDRQERFCALRDEYERTGTIALPDYSSESNIVAARRGKPEP